MANIFKKIRLWAVSPGLFLYPPFAGWDFPPICPQEFGDRYLLFQTAAQVYCVQTAVSAVIWAGHPYKAK